jgi:coenzyme F420-dependent glucose-6-phosphate dehydrogenase
MLDCGSGPETVVQQVKVYVEAGFTHLVFHAPGHDQRRFLKLFESDLAPLLRALG